MNSQPSRLPLLHHLTHGWPLLLSGGVLLATSNGRWILPLGVWLAPVLLMRYVRDARRAWLALVLLWLTLFFGMAIAWLGLWPFPPKVFMQMVAMSALWATLPYAIDRLTLRRAPPLAQSLVFPASFVAVDYLVSLHSGTTWGHVAYTQSENLPLLQLASVSGMWGIGFVIYWLASILNNAWDTRATPPTTRRMVGVYAAALITIILGGSLRLTAAPAVGETMRVAMVTPPEIVDPYSAEGVQFIQTFRQVFSKGESAPDELEDLRQRLAANIEPVFTDIRRQARAGAELVVLSEAALVSFSDAEDDDILSIARQLAREEQVHLALGIVKVPLKPEGKNENRLVLIDPAGRVVDTYFKNQTVPVIEQPFAVPGSEAAMRYELGTTTLGGVICYDLDSPQFMRTAGQQQIDVLMAPTGDGPTIKDIHSRMAVMRAVEQGFSLVRPANYGLTLATDYQGRVLARMDHFTTSEHQLSAWVPKSGVTTLYSRIGDLLPWLCLLFTFLAIARAGVGFRPSRGNQ